MRVCSRTSCLRVRISEAFGFLGGTKLVDQAGQQIGDTWHVQVFAARHCLMWRVGDNQREVLAQDLHTGI